MEHTGDLYALRHVAQPDRMPPFVDPWARLLPRRDTVDTDVFVLLVEPSRPRADTLLKGWADLQGQPGGFEELVARSDEAGYPPPW